VGVPSGSALRSIGANVRTVTGRTDFIHCVPAALKERHSVQARDSAGMSSAGVTEICARGGGHAEARSGF